MHTNVWYTDECIVSRAHINNGIIKPMCGRQNCNCNTSQILICDIYRLKNPCIPVLITIKYPYPTGIKNVKSSF